MLSTLIAFALPPWLPYAAVPATLTAFCCAMVIGGLLRRNRIRRQHVTSHREMDDAEFIRRIGLGRDEVEGEGEAAVRIRHAIAKIMRVPSATLHPSDELGYIGSFGSVKRDFVEIAWAIERALEIRIPTRQWGAFFEDARCHDLQALLRFLFDLHYLSPAGAAPSTAAPSPPATSPAALPPVDLAPVVPADPDHTTH